MSDRWLVSDDVDLRLFDDGGCVLVVFDGWTVCECWIDDCVLVLC